VAFVVALGYYAGCKQLISRDGVRTFSTFIVNFALPCMLFVGVFRFTPGDFKGAPFLLTLTLALIVPFLVSLGISLYAFKLSFAESGLFACNCGFPDMAYFGLPVLMTLVGTQALLPVIVGNLVTSIVMIPCIILMLQYGRAESHGNNSASFLGNVLTTAKKPVVWAPTLGLILVLAGVPLPSLAKAPLKLIGDTCGGAGLFTLGVILSYLKLRVDVATITVVFLKNLMMPGTALVLAWFFHLDRLLATGVIISVASPSATLGALLSAEFKVGQETIPAEVLASNLFGIVSMAFWIFVAEQIV
jgi:predicted permease